MRNSRLALARPAVAIPTTLATLLAIAACSPSGNPHLDMCKKITGNLLVGDAEFGEISESEGRREMTLVLPYASDGETGEAVCTFAKMQGGSSYQTSPKEVILDGLKVSTKDLMKASLSASKAVIKDSADETKKQAAAAAEEAKVMAGEAKEKAAELADEAKVKAGEVATQIKDSEAVERAKQLANEAKDKAKSTLIEGAKTIQENLEN